MAIAVFRNENAPAQELGQKSAHAELWWETKKSDMHSVLSRVTETLWNRNDYRRILTLHYARLYSNRLAAALTGKDFTDSADVGSKIRLNITRSVVDSAMAQIATHRTRPQYVTENGNLTQQGRAKKRGKFVTGWFHLLKLFIKSLDVFRDGEVWGTGFMQFYHCNGRIYAERALQDEFLVDDAQSRTGDVQDLFRRKTASRARLIAMYPEEEDVIARAVWQREPGEMTDRQSVGIPDPVTVYEGWHLPSIIGGKDGKHVMAVSTGCLEDDVWARPTFPVVAWRWANPLFGYFGAGLVEELSPLQIEINYIAQKIQKLMTLATSMIWTEKGSEIGEMNNEDWGRMSYTGNPPIFQTTSAVSAEYFNHMDRLTNRAYELGGISQMAAAGVRPVGLYSGEALRTFSDIGSQRFQHTGMRWEQFFLDCAEQICACAKEMQESGHDARVLAFDDKDVQELTIKDVDMDADAYILKAWPVSILPDTPAGKIETIRTMASFAPTMANYLLASVSGMPDLERAVSMANAPQDMAEKYVNEILEHGNYMRPSAVCNLTLTRDIAQRSLLRAMFDGVPDEKTQLLGRFIADIDSMQKMAMQAQIGQMAGMGGPMQPGAPQDVSGMVPMLAGSQTSPAATPMAAGTQPM